jgi:hypothetical protein
VHPEFEGLLLLSAGIVGFLVILAFSGVSEEVMVVSAIVGALVLLALRLAGGVPALYEILEERHARGSQEFRSQNRKNVDSTPVSSAASGELRRAVGDSLATELYDLERQLLEEAANGRLPAKDVARLGQELAKNRAELIEKASPDAGGSATGQPESNQTGR